MYKSKISFNKWGLAREIFKFEIKSRMHIWTQDHEREGGVGWGGGEDEIVQHMEQATGIQITRHRKIIFQQ